jgi:TIR domain
MAESAAGSTGRIFISYRRDESAYPAGWLYDRLADHCDGGQVFKDVDSIKLGDDFVEVITRAVGSCDVLLALIGEQWLAITDAQGRRRLDDPNDFVRLEIEAALARNVRIIPILVDGARMPTTEDWAADVRDRLGLVAFRAGRRGAVRVRVLVRCLACLPRRPRGRMRMCRTGTCSGLSRQCVCHGCRRI